jgi:parvulin-like peptidyl-prolyl isomerase
VEKVNLTAPGENLTADTIAATFNTLANHEAFGIQIYDVMIREAIIRAEYRARGLAINPKDVHDFWVRQLDLQREKDIDAVLPKAQDDYIALAGRYSGLSREVPAVAETFVMSLDLRPLIARENVPPAQVVQFKLKAIRAATRSDAEAALAQIKGGGDFRGAACRYSTDPSVRGNSGELGFKTRGEFVAGLNVAPVFQAGIGELVGPLQSPVGWLRVRAAARTPRIRWSTPIYPGGDRIAATPNVSARRRFRRAGPPVFAG